MIDLGSTLKISFRALRVNKMRSVLTSLGMIIGVGAVIVMLAVGAGASQQISDQIASMGSNLLIIMSGSTTSGGIRMGLGTQPTLTLNDADAVKKECPSVRDVAPLSPSTAQIVFGNQNWSTSVNGTTPSMLSIRDWAVVLGRSFTDDDVKNATKVCLLGQTVVKNLFGDLDPTGRIIRIKGIPFTVIGLLDVKGQSPQGQDQDDVIIIPITTAQKKVFGTQFLGMVRMILVKARSTQALDPAQDEITSLLKERHHIVFKQDNDFSIRNLTQTMQMAQNLLMSLPFY